MDDLSHRCLSWATDMVFKATYGTCLKRGFVVVCGGLWWFVVVCGGLWWFVVVCGGLWWFVVVFGGLWWFVVVCGGLWGHSLGWKKTVSHVFPCTSSEKVGEQQVALELAMCFVKTSSRTCLHIFCLKPGT